MESMNLVLLFTTSRHSAAQGSGPALEPASSGVARLHSFNRLHPHFKIFELTSGLSMTTSLEVSSASARFCRFFSAVSKAAGALL